MLYLLYSVKGEISLDLKQLINKYHDKLTDNDLHILSFILDNPTEIQELNIVDLAKKCHTSKSTILRLAQKLGYSGFSELKYAIKPSEVKSPANVDYMEQQKQDINTTLKLFSQSDLSELIEKIDHADRIFGYGTGWGQQNALKELSRNLMSCKKYMLSIPAKTEFDLNMPLITKDDLVIIISLSGDIKDIVENVNTLNMRGVPIISITSFTNNNLASLAPYNLYYQVTPLTINHKPELGSFITLSLVCDSLFRKYVEFMAFT